MTRREHESGAVARHGATLVELMVVIALLGIMAGVAVLAFRTAARPVGQEATMAQLMDARRAAITEGKRLTIDLVTDGQRHHATMFPDGRVVTSAPLSLDPLSGRPGDGKH